MKKSMKMAAAAIAVGAVMTLAGCGGCFGCGGCNNNKNITVTNSNWYTGTSYKGIQPSFVPEDDPAYTKEEIEYTVTFDKSQASNGVYSANYGEGKYVTEFYATHYDWSSNPVYRGEEKELLYVYKTSLEISVSFTYKSTGASTETFNDHIYTVAYFRAAGKNLQPVYSKQEIVSHSPASLQPLAVQYTYETVEKTYENYYNYDCTEITSRCDSKDTVYDKLKDIKFSIFDNSTLYIVTRSLHLSKDLNQELYLFGAAAGGLSKYTLKGAETQLDATEGQTEIKAISAELQRHGLFVPSENRETIPTVAVTINYSGGDLQGTTQTAWYAAIEDADHNLARTTLLKLSVPLSYGLGTLNYSLKEIRSTIWNG